MKQRTALALLAAFALVMVGFSSHAFGAALSLQATSDGNTPATQFMGGDSIYLNIVVNDSVGLAGCAFTVTYDATLLDPPATTAEGTPVDNSVSSVFPFTFQSQQMHRENSAESGKVYLAGATINESTGGAKPGQTDAVLFTLIFKVKNDAPIGSIFRFRLEQTELMNPAAGYGTDVDGDGNYEPEAGDTKEPVAVLVGAVAQGEAGYDNFDCSNPPCAFPVIADNLPQNSGDLEVVSCPDADGDGLCDSVETNTGIYVDASNTGSNPNSDDSDGDGLKDGDEVNTFGTNPNNGDTDGDGYPDALDANKTTTDAPGGAGYDPDADTRKYTISGNVNYGGAATQDLRIQIYSDAQMTNLVGSANYSAPTYPKPYSIADLDAKAAYYLRAYVDANSNGAFDTGEPSGETNVAIALDMSNTNITLPLKTYLLGSGNILLGSTNTYTLIAEVPAGETLKAYNFTIQYDSSRLSVNGTSIDFTGTGLNETFPPANINTETPGQIVLNGFDTTGKTGPLTLGILRILFTGAALGDSQITITVNEFGESSQNQFPPQSVPLNISVIDMLFGDADGSQGVDIFDALVIAEFDAGVITSAEVIGFAACDVDCSDSVDIFDALKVAEYDAGLIPNLDCQ
jgi:hypothetical protein